MIKNLLSYLFLGGGCSGVAIISTTFSKLELKPDALLNQSERITKKITTISNYGDIEAYGLQKGCLFRIVDETEDNPKDYSLADFLTKKKETIPTLVTEVPKLAESAKMYCGKDTPIITIFYTKKNGSDSEKIFKLKRSELITENRR